MKSVGSTIAIIDQKLGTCSPAEDDVDRRSIGRSYLIVSGLILAVCRRRRLIERTPPKFVVSLFAVEFIVIGFADQDIVVVSTGQGIIAIASVGKVHAAAALDYIVAAEPKEQIPGIVRPLRLINGIGDPGGRVITETDDVDGTAAAIAFSHFEV